MRQGEIWLVNLDPTIGAEIRKTRPCVIVNNDTVGRLPLKIVAPTTEYKDKYKDVPWTVAITPGPQIGLDKKSAIDLCELPAT